MSDSEKTHLRPETDSASNVPSTSTSKADESATAEEKSRKKKCSVQIQEPPPPYERCGYRIVKVEEKHGLLRNAVPVMPLPLAVVCCILNILGPGVGTLISSFTVFCRCRTAVARPIHAFGLNLVAAFLQMLTFFVIVGWIWSILWGMTFVQLSMAARMPKTPSSASLPYYVRRQSSVE